MMREDRIFEEIQKNVDSAIFQFAERIRDKLTDQVKLVISHNKRVDTGDLKESVAGEVERKTLELIVYIFTNTNYSQYVHEGTRPHYPNLPKIRDWVMRKGLYRKAITRGKNKGKLRMVQTPTGKHAMDDYWAIDQIARKIAWKIYRKGTKGLKFFEIALKQLTPWIERECSNWNPTL